MVDNARGDATDRRARLAGLVDIHGGSWELSPRWLPLAVFILAIVVGMLIGLSCAVVLWGTLEHRQAARARTEIRSEIRRSEEDTRSEIRQLESSVDDNFKIQQMAEGNFSGRLKALEAACLPKRED